MPNPANYKLYSAIPIPEYSKIYLSTIRLYILQAPQEWFSDLFRPRAWWGIALGTQAERSTAERSGATHKHRAIVARGMWRAWCVI